MTLGARIKKERIKKMLSQEDLAKQLGTTKQAIFKYENEIVTNIPLDKIELLSKILSVTPAYLMGWEEPEPSLPSNVHPIKLKRFPVLGEIACGTPIFASEDHETYIDASADIKADFCLIAKGDSMTGARINNGDVVFIHEQPTVENGEIAAVIIGDEATLKRWYFYPEKKKLILNPENPAFEPLVYIGPELNEVRCLGKAVFFTSKL